MWISWISSAKVPAGPETAKIFGRQVRTCVTHILGYFLIGNMIINLWMIGFNHGFPQLFEVPNNKKNGSHDKSSIYHMLGNLLVAPSPIENMDGSAHRSHRHGTSRASGWQLARGLGACDRAG